MKVVSKLFFFSLIFITTGLASHRPKPQEVLTYYGTSDASAAVALGQSMFIVADDENNILRVYNTNQTGLPVFSYDWTQFLDIDPKHPEADIEGATLLGDYIYWITSHGRNQDGRIRPSRYRFFATKVDVKNDDLTITPVGVSCKSLVHELVKDETMRKLDLGKATQFDRVKLPDKQRKKLAPKQEGLNIEALCSSTDAKTIYIGFRNPRPNSKAIVVPLSNPQRVIEMQEQPLFARPILWDLKGLGIRAMEYSDFYKAYFIIAGPHNDKPSFVLYRWSGKMDDPPKLVRELHLNKYNFTPEAMFTFKDSEKFFLLSDDGTLPIDVSDASECMPGRLLEDGKCPNKYLTDPNRKTFRAIWLQL
ncbi:MAG: DUF3616 domain-containing protein [Planctomycetota bacterium]|nr:MAG: DUF3616 domain-containing protein [Planctomycetota bacterium]